MSTMKKSSQASVGHLGIEVTDLKTSRHFYDALLHQLDCKIILDTEYTIGYANQRFQIWLAESDPPRIMRKQPSGEEEMVAEHLAILVPDQETMNAITTVMIKQGFMPRFHAKVSCQDFLLKNILNSHLDIMLSHSVTQMIT